MRTASSLMMLTILALSLLFTIPAIPGNNFDVTGNAVRTGRLVCQDGSCPFVKISDAIRDSDDNGEIWIMDNGIYREKLLINKPLSIRAAKGKRPIITGIDEGALDYAVLIIADTLLDGLDIIVDYGVEGGVVAQESVNGIKIINSVIADATVFNINANTKVALNNTIIRNSRAAGIQLNDFGILVIENSAIHSNLIGLKLAKKKNFAFIKNTDIYSNNVGIFLTNGVLQLEMSNIVNNNGHGIEMSGGRLDVYETNFVSNLIGIQKTGGTINNDFNNFYNNQETKSGFELGENSIMADPKFINPEEGDFRIYDDSSIIGKGREGSNIGSDQLCTDDYCPVLDSLISAAIESGSYAGSPFSFLIVLMILLVIFGGVFTYKFRDYIDLLFLIKRVEFEYNMGNIKSTQKSMNNIRKLYNQADDKIKEKYYPQILKLKKHINLYREVI